jgi:UDP-glucose 4-epimerase
MKALVTGGGGFIGSNLTDHLIDNGWEVVVIDNESSDANDIFFYNDKAENHILDICDYESTRPLYEGIDVVFHLAADARIQPALNNPIAAANNNFVGTCTVLQCAREAGVDRVVYSSTSSGYGNNHAPNRETQPDDCLNPYSVSKIAAEKLCNMYNSLWGLKTISLRYFNVYGYRQPIRGQYGTVIGIFKRMRDAGEPLTIVGDGDQRRDFTNVNDIVQANWLAATSKLESEDFGQVYNIGTGTNYSVNEVAEIFNHPTVNIPPRLGESRETLADITKAKKVLGYKPAVNLQEWIVENL